MPGHSKVDIRGAGKDHYQTVCTVLVFPLHQKAKSYDLACFYHRLQLFCLASVGRRRLQQSEPKYTGYQTKIQESSLAKFYPAVPLVIRMRHICTVNDIAASKRLSAKKRTWQHAKTLNLKCHAAQPNFYRYLFKAWSLSTTVNGAGFAVIFVLGRTVSEISPGEDFS